jgi:PEGA domain
MKKLLMFVALIALIASISSCALIFKGDSQGVFINSNPQGAQILVDGIILGTTPAKISLRTNRSYNITIRLAGRKDQNIVLNNHVGTLWIVLDILGGLFPLVIDAATGAWYEFDTTQLNVDLTPTLMNNDPLPNWATKLIPSHQVH